jgi:hypothetical protein
MDMPFMQPPVAPVFSTTPEGEVTDEQVTRPRRQLGNVGLHFPQARPIILQRDPVAEAEARERAVNALEAEYIPELFAARQKLEQRLQVCRIYARELSDLKFALSQTQGEANGSSPDSPQGIKEQRTARVHTLRSQVAEAEAEYQAASEEMEQAELVVREEMEKHQARLDAQKAGA